MAWHEWERTGQPEIYRDRLGGCPSDRPGFDFGWWVEATNFGQYINAYPLGDAYARNPKEVYAYRNGVYFCWRDDCPPGYNSTADGTFPPGAPGLGCQKSATQPQCSIPGSVPTNFFGLCPTGYHNANDPVTGTPCCVPDVTQPPAEPPAKPPCDFCEPTPTKPSYQDCCDKIQAALDKIAEILKCLLDGTCGATKKACDLTDECVDKLTDKVIGKLKSRIKTCDGCLEAVKLGIISETECRAMFAECKVQECENICSLSTPENEGKCCKGCGKEPCCCKGIECVECPEPAKPKKFAGWCNRETGSVLVQDTDQGSPGSQWTEASLSDDEQQALSDAQAYCQRKPQPQPGMPGPPPQFQPPQFKGVCTLATYRSPSVVDQLLSLGGFSWDDFLTETFLSSYSAKLSGLLQQIPIAGGALDASIETVIGPVQIAAIMAPQIGKLAGCDSPAVANLASYLAAIGIASKYSGFDYTQFASPIVYAMNSSCRNKLLSPSDAMAAYLANAIDDTDLETHFAIAGYCNDVYKLSRQAFRRKLDPMQLAVARRRKIISEDLYNFGMRNLGFLEQPEREVSFQLTEQVPPYSDLVRMMVRDTADPRIFETFHLDDNFTDKFQDPIKGWAESQGVPEEVMRHLWRAHWSIPSPGQLFEMYHRFRRTGQFGTEAEILEQIKLAIGQQDIAPFWQDKYIAISFRPLGRIDIRRAYAIGSIDEQQVEDAFVQLGYSDENAVILRKFNKKLRDDGAVNHRAIKSWLKFAIDGDAAIERMAKDGFDEQTIREAMRDSAMGFTASFAAKAYVNGDITPDLFRDLLKTHGVDDLSVARLEILLNFSLKPDEVLEQYEIGTIDHDTARTQMITIGIPATKADRMLSKLDTRLELRAAADCARAIKKRYLLGEIDAQGVRDQLAGRGITRERANKFVQWWQCELQTAGKHVSTNILCNWLARGAIDPQDFVKRLTTIGYSHDDAVNLLADCLGRISIQQSREAVARAKAEATAVLKQQKLAEKATKQIEAEQERIKRQRAAANKTRERRRNALLSASGRVTKRCGCDIATAFSLVESEYARVQSEFALTRDEGLQAVLKASETFTTGDLSSYPASVDAFAAEIVRDALDRDRPPPDVSDIINGATQPS